MATRAFTAAVKHRILVFLRLPVKSSQHGMLTTRAEIQSPREHSDLRGSWRAFWEFRGWRACRALGYSCRPAQRSNQRSNRTTR